MAKTKIAKDSLEFYEIKAKYETGNFTFPQLAEQYGVADKTIKRFAKSGKWIKGAEETRQLYDATKLVHQKKILTQFKKEEEKQADIVISKLAKKEGEKVALLTLQGESYKKEIEHKFAEVILLALEGVKSSSELTKSGKVTDTEFEYVDTIQGKTGTVLRKTKTLLAKDHIDLIKLGQAFGFLQIPQQQNNTQINIGGEGIKDNKLYNVVQEDPEYQKFVLEQAEKFKKA